MSVRQSRVYRGAMAAVTAAVALAGGSVAVWGLPESRSPARKTAQAEAAYARGLAAYDGQQWADAAVRFDEAKLLADGALDALQAKAAEGAMPPDEVRAALGRIDWLKFQAVRDLGYAKAQAAGKPLPVFTDPRKNEQYRSVLALTDPAALGDALGALRAAAVLPTADPAVVQEALRAELGRTPIEWVVAEPLLRRAAAADPADPRARFYLARYEFDQPAADTGRPTRPDRRAADRIGLARGHLQAARDAGAGPWRAAGLEAEIGRWEVAAAVARKAKPAALAAAERDLDTLLFGTPDGVVDKLGRGEQLVNLGRADADGLAAVLAVGMDRAVAAAAKPGGTPDRARAVLRTATGLAASDAAAVKPFAADLLVAAVDVAARAQLTFARLDPAGWKQAVGELDAAVAKLGGQALRPTARLHLATLTHRDALAAARGDDPTLAKSLTAHAIQLLTDGPPSADAHLALAEWRLLAGERLEAVRPHLDAVAGSADPRVKAVAQFLHAVAAERQGKLDDARKRLRPLAADRSHPDLRFRANLLSVTLALAAGDPAAALAALREAEPVYAKLDDAQPDDRAWAAEFVGGLDDLAALQAVASLDMAYQAAVRAERDAPGRPVPPEVLAPHEAGVAGLLQKIKRPTVADRTSRLAVARHQARTGRRPLAERTLADLAADYPASLEVLRARVTLAGGIAPDPLIGQFLIDYPGDRAAKLFRAEWLVRTDRAAQAVEYLRDRSAFPARDAAVDRVLGVALYQAGLRDEAKEVLDRLPPDPAVVAVLIRSAATAEAAEARLADALTRFDNAGLLQVYRGAVLLDRKRFAEAAAEFATAVPVTQVRPAAQAGLLRALLAYAGADPAGARELVVKLAADLPDEPGLYLAAALAALRLDEVGTATDNWDRTKSVFAAVNRWEQLAVNGGLPRPDATVVRATFRALAGDPDGARREAAAGLARAPEHVPTLLQLADLFLRPPADPAAARGFFDRARRANPADPRLPFVEARLIEADGDAPGAAAVYERVVAASPRDPAAYPLLIAAREAAGDRPAALKAARDWHDRLPRDDRAALALVRLLARTGGTAEALREADAFADREGQAAAERLAGGLIPAAPGAAEAASSAAKLTARAEAADALYRGGAAAEGVARATAVLTARPGDERALTLLGRAAIDKQDWDAAAAAYTSVLAANPRHYAAGNNLAWILAEKRGDPAAAIKWVEAVRAGPSGSRPMSPERLPAEFLDTLGLVYRKLNQPERFKEMVAVFTAAAARHPADPRMRLHLGVAQAATADPVAAKESLTAAVNLAQARNGLGAAVNAATAAAATAELRKLGG